MKKILTLIMVIILTLSICFIFKSKTNFSEKENRYLMVFPEFSINNILDSSYTSDIDNYLNDHFPFRDFFLSLKSNIELLLGNTKINGVYINEDYQFLEYNTNTNLESIVNKLNNFYENNNDININLLIIPSSGLVNNYLLPNFVSYDNEYNDLLYIYENINFNVIKVLDNFIIKNKETKLYFKTDHHYNIYGAYEAYKSYCNELNITCNEDLTFTLGSNNFFGTLSSKTNIFTYKDSLYYYEINSDITVNYHAENIETNTLYEEFYLNKKDKYSFFLGGNHSLITVDTDVENGKEILIIKDSYANSFIPFLTDNYEKIHVIDLRFYNLSITDYITDNNVQEVLFLYSSTGFNEESGLNLLR